MKIEVRIRAYYSNVYYRILHYSCNINLYTYYRYQVLLELKLLNFNTESSVRCAGRQDALGLPISQAQCKRQQGARRAVGQLGSITQDECQ